jgi:hypothetical protein
MLPQLSQHSMLLLLQMLLLVSLTHLYKSATHKE